MTKTQTAKGTTHFLKAAEITVLSSHLASSFEKNPKPLNEAVCPDLVGLLAGGVPVLTVFHIGTPLAPALPSESVGSSSILTSGLIRFGLAS